MGPAPRSAILSAITRARTIGARRLTMSARSISSTLNENTCPEAGRPAFATSTSTSPWSVARRSTAAASVRSTATDRAPVSAASGSSTSVRRPVRISRASARCRRRAMGRPRPPGAPGGDQPRIGAVQAAGDGLAETARRAGEQDGPPGEVHRGNTATVAVNPWRNGSPPTGPISPAAKNPAAGAPANSSSSASASWSGTPNIERPRPLQVKTSAPAGAAPPSASTRRPSDSRRSRSAERASRACIRTTEPGSTGAPTATVPSSGSAPRSGRTRKSPWRYSGLPPSITTPSRRPLATIPRSASVSSSIASRRRSSAGRPASSWMTFASEAVTVSSGPTGAAPCDTHGRISTSWKRTPTAPAPTTRLPTNSAASPPGVRALASPPRIVTPGQRRPTSPSTASVGNVYGSGSRTAAVASSRCERPLTPTPSGVSIASAWNASAMPPPSEAAQTAIAVPLSISRPAPSTPPAPHPTSAGGSSASATPSSVASGAARWRPAQKRNATSAAAPPSPARARVPASIAATRGSGLVDSPQPMRTLTSRTILRAMAADAAVLAIFGPTGVGKTALAFALADRLRARGERPVAVSADALQVYRGLETLTGVPPAAEQARLEHRLVSILPVDARFSAGEYAQLAHAEIDGLIHVGARPIVVGGTGLYVRAALADLGLRPPPPGELRARLEAELEQRGPEALHERL